MVSPENGRTFVWAWLPGRTEPVVAGRLDVDGPRLVFTYGASYRDRPDAVPLYLPELPLRSGPITPPVDLDVASCIRDAAPDAWGQRVILDRLTGRRGRNAEVGDLPLLAYLRESGSNRIGALDFQDSPTEYVPRSSSVPFQDLLADAAAFAEGTEVSSSAPSSLSTALVDGTSIGGARPKVLLHEDGPPREMIAKFSLGTDLFPVIKAEAAAMFLAERAGLTVAGSRLRRVLHRDVLLVDRFDRPGCLGSAPGALGERQMMVSALTLLGGDERNARYLAYPDLADVIRARFEDPTRDLHELFARVVFNILVSNNDDHARNHSAFWDGASLRLTPAYDLAPGARTGATSEQAMAIDREGRRASRLSLAVASARHFLLDEAVAREVVAVQLDAITDNWAEAADAAQLTAREREQLWGRQFVNPAVHYDDWT